MKLMMFMLVALFFYDIFWVFFSKYFFGANVMETVATQQSPNPVSSVVSAAPALISLPTSITSMLLFILLP